MSEIKMQVDPKVIFSQGEWDDLLDATMTTIKALAKAKGGEYSGDYDRLANFRRNGAGMDLPMEAIWRVYAAKHWDAICQYENDLRQGKTRERSESITGRADDLLVYLILFKAMCKERGVG